MAEALRGIITGALGRKEAEWFVTRTTGVERVRPLAADGDGWSGPDKQGDEQLVDDGEEGV